MNLNSFLAIAITLFVSSTSVLGAAVVPTNSEPFSVRCVFHLSCFSDQKCIAEDSEVTIIHETQGALATITLPNGSVVLGPVMTATKFDTIEYKIVMASDGSGASHFTILPNSSVIWTSHLTLEKNISYTHFGLCEDPK